VSALRSLKILNVVTIFLPSGNIYTIKSIKSNLNYKIVDRAELHVSKTLKFPLNYLFYYEMYTSKLIFYPSNFIFLLNFVDLLLNLKFYLRPDLI
jgi:hypothetical protein